MESCHAKQRQPADRGSECQPEAPLNAFTVDVEDYFQVTGFERDIRRDDWHRYPSRVEANVHAILKLLEDHRVRATFFVLGWIARRHPHLVREMHACGHEIASHGYWHRLIYHQSPEEFRDDVRSSRIELEDAVGQRVTAYRAPSFSITRRSLWALSILAEEGFLADSSIFPVRHDRYGISDAPRELVQLETPSGPLWELPMPVFRLGRFPIPVGGGGYFRLYPLAWTRAALRHLNRRGGQPFVFYMHPWEIDPGQPRLRAGSRLSRFRHYVNLGSTLAKTGRLLHAFRFGTVGEVIASHRQRPGEPRRPFTFDPRESPAPGP